MKNNHNPLDMMAIVYVYLLRSIEWMGLEWEEEEENDEIERGRS